MAFDGFDGGKRHALHKIKLVSKMLDIKVLYTGAQVASMCASVSRNELGVQ